MNRPRTREHFPRMKPRGSKRWARGRTVTLEMIIEASKQTARAEQRVPSVKRDADHLAKVFDVANKAFAAIGVSTNEAANAFTAISTRELRPKKIVGGQLQYPGAKRHLPPVTTKVRPGRRLR